MLRLIYFSINAGQRVFGFFRFSRLQAIIELLEKCSQAAAVASIPASMLQILSVRLEGRGMIRHPIGLLYIVNQQPTQRAAALKLFTLQAVNIRVKSFFAIDFNLLQT